MFCPPETNKSRSFLFPAVLRGNWHRRLKWSVNTGTFKVTLQTSRVFEFILGSSKQRIRNKINLKTSHHNPRKTASCARKIV